MVEEEIERIKGELVNIFLSIGIQDIRKENITLEPKENENLCIVDFKNEDLLCLEDLSDISNSLKGKKFERAIRIKIKRNLDSLHPQRRKLNFYKCDFHSSILLSEGLVHKHLIFDECSFYINPFYENESSEKFTFDSSLRFSFCVFEQDILENNSTFNQSLMFLASTFKKSVNFSGCSFNKEMNFIHCNLQSVFFSYSDFKEKVNFFLSQFHKKVYFNNTNFDKDVNFTQVIFENLHFFYIMFNDRVIFSKAQFTGKANLNDITFERLVDFYQSKFSEDQLFHLIDFNDRAIFSNVEFQGAVQFLHTRVTKDSYVSFENAYFSLGLDISRANFSCTTNFWGADFKDLKMGKLKDIDLYKNDESGGNPDPKKAIRRIRESFRLIKYSFRQTENKIEARRFHVREMKAYQAELWLDESRLEKLKSRLGEKTLLFLNCISNNHGQSWLRALAFTLGVTLVCFVILAILSDDVIWSPTGDGFKYAVKHFLQLLNITNWNYVFYRTNIESYPSLYITFFIGRIAIGYGIYQFIAAFRKHAKN